MLNKFKNMFKNQKGFTLVEILVVIVIIGILFTVILPRIDFASDRARQTGVKTDFKAFQTAAEGYFRETAGQGLTTTGVNTYLDKALQISGTATTVATAAVAANPTFIDSNKEDPWGTKYKFFIAKPSAQSAQIIIKSTGKTGGNDYYSATYYSKGTIESCTANFGGTQDIKLSSISIATTPPGGDSSNCGGNIS